MDSGSIDNLLKTFTTNLSSLQREELHQQLTGCINYLLVNDFSRLVQILYRVDVDEKRLKHLLQANPRVDAAILITDLLIQRQEEKNQIRNSFPLQDITDDEKW